MHGAHIAQSQVRQAPRCLTSTRNTSPPSWRRSTKSSVSFLSGGWTTRMIRSFGTPSRPKPKGTAFRARHVSAASPRRPPGRFLKVTRRMQITSLQRIFAYRAVSFCISLNARKLWPITTASAGRYLARSRNGMKKKHKNFVGRRTSAWNKYPGQQQGDKVTERNSTVNIFCL